jgi:small subunit ribosomal protein S15
MAEKLTESEVENIIVELAKQGTTAEKIGLILKKDNGIKNFEKEYHKKISKVLRENNVYISPDKRNLSLHVEKLKKHLDKNKLDHPTGRILLIQEAKLRKLVKLGY